LDYSVGKIDGDFGPATDKAVRTFQANEQLEENGIVDDSIWEILLERCPDVPVPTNPIDESLELWLPDIEKINGMNGPKFVSFPWRGLLHTTEGNTADDAISSYRNTNFWPHFTIEPNTSRIIQHLPLNIGARALNHNAGEIETNAAHCIQIEIVGRAKESPSWSPEILAFIRDLMRQIESLVPIPRQSGLLFLDHNHKMSNDEWRAFSGWCGHQHVPQNDHWDPGAIDIDSLLA
jgi:hypothetical protein